MVNILYEDNHIIVCEKPQGIPSQEDISKDKDMLTIVKEYVKEKYNKQGNVYVGLVHRLDRPTGGIMVFAKTSKAASRLCNQIKSEEKDFKKKYLAVVVGCPKNKKGKLVSYLLKDEKENKVREVNEKTTGAKRAELDYNCLVYNEKHNLSLIEISLYTGRSHQIRVQLCSMKTPIFGDSKYGGDVEGKTNLCLWAYRLSFVHPTTKELMTFKSRPPTQEYPWKYFENEIKSL